MKFAATVLTLLALAGSLSARKLSVAGSGEVAQDSQDTFDLVPPNKSMKVARAYLVEDNHFSSSLDIEKSPELNAFLKDIEASPEFANLARFVQGGLNETLARSYPKDMSETETTGLAGSAKDSDAPVPAGKPQNMCAFCACFWC